MFFSVRDHTSACGCRGSRSGSANRRYRGSPSQVSVRLARNGWLGPTRVSHWWAVRRPRLVIWAGVTGTVAGGNRHPLTAGDQPGSIGPVDTVWHVPTALLERYLARSRNCAELRAATAEPCDQPGLTSSLSAYQYLSVRELSARAALLLLSSSIPSLPLLIIHPHPSCSSSPRASISVPAEFSSFPFFV